MKMSFGYRVKNSYGVIVHRLRFNMKNGCIHMCDVNAELFNPYYCLASKITDGDDDFGFHWYDGQEAEGNPLIEGELTEYENQYSVANGYDKGDPLENLTFLAMLRILTFKSKRWVWERMFESSVREASLYFSVFGAKLWGNLAEGNGMDEDLRGKWKETAERFSFLESSDIGKMKRKIVRMAFSHHGFLKGEYCVCEGVSYNWAQLVRNKQTYFIDLKYIENGEKLEKFTN